MVVKVRQKLIHQLRTFFKFYICPDGLQAEARGIESVVFQVVELEINAK